MTEGKGRTAKTFYCCGYMRPLAESTTGLILDTVGKGQTTSFCSLTQACTAKHSNYGHAMETTRKINRRGNQLHISPCLENQQTSSQGMYHLSRERKQSPKDFALMCRTLSLPETESLKPGYYQLTILSSFQRDLKSTMETVIGIKTPWGFIHKIQ